MAWTQADIDKLKTAIAKGVTKVRLNNEEITYRSLAEMRGVLVMMQAEVNGQAQGAFTTSYPRTTRGL